jgi:vancomycin permeability regulator SanA
VLIFRLVGRLIAMVVTLALLVFLGTCFMVWKVARDDNRPSSDAIVVLGASQFNGRPSEIFTARLKHARTLHRAAVAPRIITVGGKLAADRYTEAAAGATWLVRNGVPRAAVTAVPTGANTLDSLRAIDALFERHRWRSAVIVTDPWHELRCRRIASDLGLRVATSPARSGPAVHTRATQFRYVLREAAGYLYYRIFHDDRARGPGAA